MQWYYSLSGSPTGPVTEDEVDRLFDEGTISVATLLWSKGMEQWMRLDEIGEFRAMVDATRPPPPPPDAPPMATAYVAPVLDEWKPNSQVLSKAPAGYPTLAGPWTRYWARIIDVGIVGSAILTALFIALPSINYQWFTALAPVDNRVLVIFILPLIAVVNALTTSLFGNTLGKAIFGIRAEVIGENTRLRLGEALGREFRVWVSGLALGIPLLNFFTMGSGYRRAASGLPTWYDAGQFTVRSYSRNGFRRVIGILLGIALTILIAYSNVIEKDALARVRVPTSWTNPVTGLSAQLPAGWIPEVVTGPDGGTIYGFTYFDTGLVALFATESPAGPMTYDTYTNNLTAALAPTTNFQGEWEPLAPNLWRAIGSGEGEKVATTIFVTWDGASFWRLVYVDQNGVAGKDLSEPGFRNAVLGTTGASF